jgi:hypothetical protein
MKDMPKRRRRLAPRGLWTSFTIFLLSVVILGHWLRLSTYPTSADAPREPATRERMRPAEGLKTPQIDRAAFDPSPMAFHGWLPLTAQAETPLSTEPSEGLDGKTLQSDSFGPGSPIVPGAISPFEAWPEPRVTEEVVPSTPSFARPMPLETGDAKPPR